MLALEFENTLFRMIKKNILTRLIATTWIINWSAPLENIKKNIFLHIPILIFLQFPTCRFRIKFHGKISYQLCFLDSTWQIDTYETKLYQTMEFPLEILWKFAVCRIISNAGKTMQILYWLENKFLSSVSLVEFPIQM